MEVSGHGEEIWERSCEGTEQVGGAGIEQCLISFGGQKKMNMTPSWPRTATHGNSWVTINQNRQPQWQKGMRGERMRGRGSGMQRCTSMTVTERGKGCWCGALSTIAWQLRPRRTAPWQLMLNVIFSSILYCSIAKAWVSGRPMIIWFYSPLLYNSASNLVCLSISPEDVARFRSVHW